MLLQGIDFMSANVHAYHTDVVPNPDYDTLELVDRCAFEYEIT